MTMNNKKNSSFRKSFCTSEPINLKKFDSLLKEKRLISQSFSVPVTDQFSNYFYQNIEEIYSLKDLLIQEGIDLNTQLSLINKGKQGNSVLPLWN